MMTMAQINAAITHRTQCLNRACYLGQPHGEAAATWTQAGNGDTDVQDHYPHYPGDPFRWPQPYNYTPDQLMQDVLGCPYTPEMEKEVVEAYTAGHRDGWYRAVQQIAHDRRTLEMNKRISEMYGPVRQ